MRPTEPLDEFSNYFDVHAERRLVVRDSAVGGFDSGNPPLLVRSSCLRSRKAGTSESWGVCSTD